MPVDDQLGLRQQIIFTILDKDFLGQKGIDIATIEIPEKYKDKILDKAFITYWQGEKVMMHSSLQLSKGRSFSELRDKKDPFNKSGSKVIEFSLNNNSDWVPKITMLYGNMCYSRHQLNIDNLSDFKRIANDEFEWHSENQNNIFIQGR